MGDYFPDYTGGDNYDAACDYLLHRFVSLNQSATTKQIYAHYTCATDTQQIKCEFCVSFMSKQSIDPALNTFSCIECYSRYSSATPPPGMWSTIKIYVGSACYTHHLVLSILTTVFLSSSRFLYTSSLGHRFLQSSWLTPLDSRPNSNCKLSPLATADLASML